MPKKRKATTEFVASVIKPNRDTPIKRQKAKEINNIIMKLTHLYYLYIVYV